MTVKARHNSFNRANNNYTIAKWVLKKNNKEKQHVTPALSFLYSWKKSKATCQSKRQTRQEIYKKGVVCLFDC